MILILCLWHTLSEIKNNGEKGEEGGKLEWRRSLAGLRKCEKIDTLIAGKQINQFTPNEVILRRERNKGVD